MELNSFFTPSDVGWCELKVTAVWDKFQTEGHYLWRLCYDLVPTYYIEATNLIGKFVKK